jgi:hypothetical protein
MFESVLSLSFGVPPESDFTSALSDAETTFAGGQSYLTDAGMALSEGGYAAAAEYDAIGSFYDVAGVQILLEGVAASF